MSEDFPLPRLSPHLILTPAPETGGEPAWTIHDPLSNSYHRIDWLAFECLARFSRFKTASLLKQAVETETTLHPTIPQIAALVLFLQKSGLVDMRDQVHIEKARAPDGALKKLLHHYLYFTLPLVRPQKFLAATLPYMRFLFSRIFIGVMLAWLALMVIITIPRIDEFFQTFASFLSFEGAISIFLTLSFVKIIHEMAHAYTAHRNGVAVPHMGVAFMVMYPVLYTETTASWSLKSRRARFEIGVAGILAELCLAGIFLALWHIFPSGTSAQSACFLVVAVSLTSSLLINLNPLMRFDGYYMLSDLIGEENLQSRSVSFALWRLRGFLFGWCDSPPESLSTSRARFLTGFGFSLIVYRFFLFSGIALMVYYLFPQPLGLILFLVEITWFILLPVWKEIRFWITRRDDIFASTRGKAAAALCVIAILALILPWQSSMTLPALLHARHQQAIYAPEPSRIITLHVKPGQKVKKDDLMVTLESPALENAIAAAAQDYQKIERLHQRAQTDPSQAMNELWSDQALEKARLTLESLRAQESKLVIRAPFDGEIRDLLSDTQEGRFIARTERLFTVVNTTDMTISAYATEDQLDRIKPDMNAVFVPDTTWDGRLNATVTEIAQTGETTLSWLELASIHKGPVASDQTNPQAPITARRALYALSLPPKTRPQIDNSIVRRGHVRVEARYTSPLASLFKWLGNVARRDIHLG